MTRYLELVRELRELGYEESRRGKGRHVILASPYGKITVPKQGGDLNGGLVAHIRCTAKRQINAKNEQRRPT